MTRLLDDLVRAYHDHIVDRGKEGQFLILTAFVLTFVVVRWFTHGIRRGRRLFRNVHVAGQHIHHLVPGILLLIVTGYLAIAIHSEDGRRTVAVLYGVGAALTLDEFALWLHLRDVYWEAQGRRSVDVVIVAAGIGGLVLLGPGFWFASAHALLRVPWHALDQPLGARP